MNRTHSDTSDIRYGKFLVDPALQWLGPPTVSTTQYTSFSSVNVVSSVPVWPNIKRVIYSSFSESLHVSPSPSDLGLKIEILDGE